MWTTVNLIVSIPVDSEGEQQRFACPERLSVKLNCLSDGISCEQMPRILKRRAGDFLGQPLFLYKAQYSMLPILPS